MIEGSSTQAEKFGYMSALRAGVLSLQVDSKSKPLCSGIQALIGPYNNTNLKV